MLDKLLELRKRKFLPFKQEYWISEPEAYALYFLLQEHDIDTFIEIGTCNGFSSCVATAAMLDNKKITEVHTWDIHSRRKVYEMKDFLSLKPYITFYNELFFMRKKFLDNKVAFFIDGDHTSGGVNRDWESVRDFVKKGDIVIFHDVLGYRCIMRMMIRLNKKGYKTSILRTRRGIGVVSIK